MYLRQRCSDGSLNKTILKPHLAAATGRQHVYVEFSRRNKILRSSAYTISEKAVRFRHPDYNPDRAQKLISSSMSRHLSTRNISSKSVHAFLSNLANRQTDRQTDRQQQYLTRHRPTDKQTRAKTFTSSFVGGKTLITNYVDCVTVLDVQVVVMEVKDLSCLSSNKIVYCTMEVDGGDKLQTDQAEASKPWSVSFVSYTVFTKSLHCFG